MADYYFEYDAANRIFAARFSAEVTDAIFQDFYAAAPRYIKPLDVKAGIADFSGVTLFEISTALVRETAKLMPLLPDPTPRFAVAPANHIYGMARMFQMVSDGRRENLYIVRSLQEAYRALDVKTPQFEKLS